MDILFVWANRRPIASETRDGPLDLTEAAVRDKMDRIVPGFCLEHCLVSFYKTYCILAYEDEKEVSKK